MPSQGSYSCLSRDDAGGAEADERCGTEASEAYEVGSGLRKPVHELPESTGLAVVFKRLDEDQVQELAGDDVAAAAAARCAALGGGHLLVAPIMAEPEPETEWPITRPEYAEIDALHLKDDHVRPSRHCPGDCPPGLLRGVRAQAAALRADVLQLCGARRLPLRDCKSAWGRSYKPVMASFTTLPA